MWRFSLCLLLVSLFIMGCSSDRSLDTPPDIRYGEDICDQCRMIISEARFAAGYVTTQGTERRFDDIGDMLLFHTKHAEDVAVFWVHDYDTEEWIRADQAFFVLSKALHTPMGHGVVATRTQSRATEIATRTKGVVLSFADLQKRFLAQGISAAHGQHHQSKKKTGPTSVT